MASHPELQELLEVLSNFAQATSWSQSKRVLEQHPELLGEEVDTLLLLGRGRTEE